MRTYAYTYNKAGERLTQTVNGTTEAYDWNVHGVLTSVTGGIGTRTFSFDAAGNLTSITPQAGPTTLFAYDSSGRTKQVTAPDGAVVKYRYGPDERRTLMSVDNDHLSTPRALTDENGVVVWSARYEPFGGTGNTENPDITAGDVGIDANGDTLGPPLAQPIRFPGQWDDGVPGVWYNWHRSYSPQYGMYLQRDPMGYIAATAEWPGFAYAGLSPIALFDATGLAWVYIYAGEATDFGHAAIETSGVYMSYWPDMPLGFSHDFQSKAQDQYSYRDGECRRYWVGEPDADEAATLLNAMRLLDHAEPWVLSNNCVDAVLDVLRGGGLDISYSDMVHGVSSALGLYWPSDLADALEDKGFEACECDQ